MSVIARNNLGPEEKRPLGIYTVVLTKPYKTELHKQETALGATVQE